MSEPLQEGFRSVDVRCSENDQSIIEVGIFDGEDCVDTVPFLTAEQVFCFRDALDAAMRDAGLLVSTESTVRTAAPAMRAFLENLHERCLRLGIGENVDVRGADVVDLLQELLPELRQVLGRVS